MDPDFRAWREGCPSKWLKPGTIYSGLDRGGDFKNTYSTSRDNPIGKEIKICFESPSKHDTSAKHSTVRGQVS